MSNTITCGTELANSYPVQVQVRGHTFRSDVGVSSGSTDSAPGPHDYFDASLAACKAVTATWYARKKGIPLERVETRVESDNSGERSGKYKLTVRVAFHGPLSAEHRKPLYAAIPTCPIHTPM